MKFKEEIQKNLLLIEIGEFSSVSDNPLITEEQEKIFIQKRTPELNHLVDFKKSQKAKSAWRRHRYDYMTGIKKFHNSTKGKKFHRQLGTFLATHNFTDSILNQGLISEINKTDESLDKFCQNKLDFGYVSIADTAATLKALSSLKTHILIEAEFFKPLFEEYSFRCLLEDSTEVLKSLEDSLLCGYDKRIAIADLEFLFRITDNAHLPLVAEKLNLDISHINERYNASRQSLEAKGYNQDMDGFFILTYTKMLNNLSK